MTPNVKSNLKASAGKLLGMAEVVEYLGVYRSRMASARPHAEALCRLAGRPGLEEWRHCILVGFKS